MPLRQLPAPAGRGHAACCEPPDSPGWKRITFKPDLRAFVERILPTLRQRCRQTSTDRKVADHRIVLALQGVFCARVPISSHATIALARASAAPIAMISLKACTKDSAIACPIDCRVIWSKSSGRDGGCEFTTLSLATIAMRRAARSSRPIADRSHD